MMAERKRVTDPALLQALEAPTQRRKVADPAILARLNGEPVPLVDAQSTNDPANTMGIPVFNRPPSDNERAALTPPERAPWSGSVLPFSENADGQVRFDPQAGVIGQIVRALQSGAPLPGDVYSGKVNPTSDEGIARSMDLAAIASPMSVATKSGDAVIPGAKLMLEKKPKAPTSEALRAAADQGYDAVRDSGVDYSSASISQLANGVRTSLEKDGFIAELAPQSFSVLSKLANPPEGSIAPIAGVDAARRALSKIRQSATDPTERETANQIIRQLDGFIERPPEGSVLRGPAQQAGASLVEARGNYAASKRSDTITGIEDAAELRAAAANSGQNLDNSIRGRMASLIENRKRSAGFNDDERAAIEAIIRGTGVQNTARIAGNVLGGGGGLGAVASGFAGATAAGPVGALAPAGGYLLKALENRIAKRSVDRLAEETRKRSPLYETAKAAAPWESSPPEIAAALARLLANPNNQEMTPERRRLVEAMMAERGPTREKARLLGL